MFPDLFHLKRAVLALALLTVIPAPLFGQELKLIPSLAVKEEYNDNIFLSTGEKRDDFITTVTPSLELSSRTERRDGSLAAGINWLKYVRNTDSDSVDYFARGAFGYRLDPRLTLSAGAGYTKNSRPDQIDPDTGLAISTGIARQNYQAGGSYAFSEKRSGTLSYAYTQEEYDHSTLVDNMSHQVTAGLSYRLDPETSLENAVTFSRQLTDVSQVDNYSATMGLAKRFRELWSFSLNAGGRYSHSVFDMALLPRESNDDWGWVGNLSFIYSGEKMNSTISFNHDVTIAAGRTGSTERTGGSVRLGNRFTQELSGSIGLGYFWNKSDQGQFSVRAIDERTLDLNCLLRYDFTKDLALEANYHYYDIDFNQSGTQAIQNIFMLRLIMRHTMFL